MTKKLFPWNGPPKSTWILLGSSCTFCWCTFGMTTLVPHIRQPCSVVSHGVCQNTPAGCLPQFWAIQIERTCIWTPLTEVTLPLSLFRCPAVTGSKSICFMLKHIYIFWVLTWYGMGSLSTLACWVILWYVTSHTAELPNVLMWTLYLGFSKQTMRPIISAHSKLCMTLSYLVPFSTSY